MYSLILLNGGVGARVAAGQPKQFVHVNGLPILVYSLVAADATDGITQIVLNYPNGDVSPERGACTDVVIRAMRAAGVDLQKEVHEDITRNFTIYPQKWGLKKPDANIDHRRVPNLQTFFARRGKAVPVTNDSADYKPGDIVSWDLNGKGLAHIGIVSNLWNERTKRYLVIHNIGRGAEAQDVLFDWQITGHYRYF